MAGRIKELEKYKSRPIIVSDASGARAPAAAAELRKHGFGEVVVAARRGFGLAAGRAAAGEMTPWPGC